MNFEWEGTVESTQDTARLAFSSKRLSPPFAVGASSQSSGRGTSQRQWFSPDGNLYLTVCLPSAPLFKSGVPITLFPLKVGCITASAIKTLLPPELGSVVKLKWPNDVLMDRKKVSGVLIEMEGDSLLIGVGVNVKTAPTIPDSGDNLGRESTCVGSYAALPDIDSAVRGIGEEIATKLGEWFSELSTSSPDLAGSVVSEFSSQVEFGVRIRMREGGWVVPLRIEADGQLLVREETTGEERLLCSDYML